jgi:hypothetical protein
VPPTDPSLPHPHIFLCSCISPLKGGASKRRGARKEDSGASNCGAVTPGSGGANWKGGHSGLHYLLQTAVEIGSLTLLSAYQSCLQTAPSPHRLRPKLICFAAQYALPRAFLLSRGTAIMVSFLGVLQSCRTVAAASCLSREHMQSHIRSRAPCGSETQATSDSSLLRAFIKPCALSLSYVTFPLIAQMICTLGTSHPPCLLE